MSAASASGLSRFVTRVLRPVFGPRAVFADAADSDRDARCFSRLALISSRIIDKAALDTAARDCSGTVSRAFKKACATGLVPRGRRVEAGACFAMRVLQSRVARDGVPSLSSEYCLRRANERSIDN